MSYKIKPIKSTVKFEEANPEMIKWMNEGYDIRIEYLQVWEPGSEKLKEPKVFKKALPLDLINYPVKNSFRELEWTDDAVEYGGVRQLKEPLAYDEKPVNGYDGNPFVADGGNALEAAEPTIFLLPYWLGRYFGLLGD